MSAELLPEWVADHQLSTIPGAANAEDDYSAAHVDTEDIAEAILDIDIPAALIPSSTPGHFHLYIDKPMSASVYMRLLDALAEAGIIEPQYASVSKARGYTSVRLPWVKKSSTKETA